ncbi:Remorin, C-terminal protein [Heracleum sosnowskyi]|uniref:Remorin, C-terminal protein n=1 Tax=Heracleum sosnowskyi TaxID=360622 RepID=A0AAD8MGQ5_9APIA|nr:Remorin, C-terminal protein [Heracleum sosnowskyi]
MKNNSVLLHNTGTYTSPGTPDNNAGGEFQKGWCSERVPLPPNSSRSHINATALIPFSSGRPLPSKWDDADRWITSPLSGNAAPLVKPQRHHKSKSGPLGAPGVSYFPDYSPSVPAFQRGKSRSFMAPSPLTTGVLVPEGLSLHYGGGMGLHSKMRHSSMAPSDNAAGWTSLLSDFSTVSSGDDEKLDDSEDPETEKSSHVESRRDMATQMSPEGSQSGRLSFVISPPVVPFPEDQRSNYSAKLEVRDVQVDKGVTVTRQSRKDGTRISKTRSPDVKDIVSSWNTTEASKKTSKLSKQEARIAAWENLQKAKAEAAINKLEMKLEKRRTASMDRILNKLRIAQTKAQDLRVSVSDNHANNAPRSKPKVVPFRKFVKMGSLGGCFTGHLK